MNEFTVSEKDSGQRLDKFIARLIPLAPKSFLYKALRNKDIRLNGKKAAGNEPLEPGDKILFRFPDVQFADLGGKISREGRCLSAKNEKEGSCLPCENDSTGSSTDSGFPSHPDRPERTLDPKYGTVLYEDEDILLADKKSGVLSQKAKPEDTSINEALLELCGGKADTFTPSVCNRLDRNTSGLIIFAKTYRGAREMTRELRERSASKFYLAAVAGRVTESVHLKARLLKNEKENRVSVLSAEDVRGELIETAYEPVAYAETESGVLTLLKIRLITGKTHQIRAHLASEGIPVLGDVKYGRREDSRKLPCSRLMLHSYELDLPGRGVYYAPIPEEFRKLFSVSERL